MSTHTPGPWTVEVHDTTTTIEALSQTVAVDVSNCDAALIAAAPELLEALRAALTWLPYVGDGAPLDPEIDLVLAQCRAAITKATGP